MHTVSIQPPLTSERLKHLETRGSNEVCGSLVTSSTIVPDHEGGNPFQVGTLSTSSHASFYGADCERIERRCRAVKLSAEAELPSSFYDHSLASASAQALLPR